ncbi:MAG: hypothetical protein JST59_29610 [Actinobacteria bacterium]|nr:hypothetical protein [Actinomycetota bacterium]
MSDDTETRTVEIEATARATIREYWVVEIPDGFESMAEDEQRDWLDEHPGDCLRDEVEGDEEERDWKLDGPFEAPGEHPTMREILTGMGMDVSREPQLPENRSELSDEEWADVFREARALMGKWIRDVRGRVWVASEIDLKDGWPTVGGRYYWARPEECTVIDVAAELAALERLRATDHQESRATDYLDDLDQVEIHTLVTRVIGEDRISSDALRDLLRKTGIASEEEEGAGPG